MCVILTLPDILFLHNNLFLKFLYYPDISVFVQTLLTNPDRCNNITKPDMVKPCFRSNKMFSIYSMTWILCIWIFLRYDQYLSSRFNLISKWQRCISIDEQTVKYESKGVKQKITMTALCLEIFNNS